MFRIVNRNTDYQEDFENRDQLLYYLENEGARLKGQGLSQVFQLTQISEEDEILDKMILELPTRGLLDEVLAKFGQVKEKKKKGIMSSKKDDSRVVSQMSPQVLAEEAPRKPVSAPELKTEETKPKKKRAISLLSQLSLFLALGLGAVSVYSYRQTMKLAEEVQTTQKELAALKTIQAEEHQLDTFVRYFLPAYYSGDTNKMADYVAEDFPAQTAQAQSVILENISLKGNVYQLNYVLLLKQEAESKNVRLKVEVQTEKDAKYGYVVAKAPKETPYP